MSFSGKKSVDNSGHGMLTKFPDKHAVPLGILHIISYHVSL